jgi:hypothetical protein
MKSLIATTALVTTLALSVAGTALAQSPVATESADLRRAIRERIEQTLQNTQVTESPYVGYIGNVEQVGTATFTIVTPRGENRTIQIGTATRLVSGSTSIQLSELVIGNSVAVIGQEMDDLVVDALRVIAGDDPLEEDRRAVIGTITNIDTRSITLQVRGSGITESFLINRNTVYEDIQGTKIVVGDLDVDESVLVVTDKDAQNQNFVKRLRLLVAIEE